MYGPAGETFNGAVGFKVGAASLGEAGRVAHPLAGRPNGYTPPIARSLVIDDKLYTLSYEGLQANRLDTLAPLAFAAFPPPPQDPGSGARRAGDRAVGAGALSTSLRRASARGLTSCRL